MTSPDSFSRIEEIANENRTALATILTELRELRAVADRNAVRLDRVENTFERLRDALVPKQRGRFKVEASASVVDAIFDRHFGKFEK